MSEPSTDSDETILWSGSVSHWHYAGRWFFIMLLLGAFVATFWIHPSGDETVLWISRGVLAVIALVVIIWIHFDRSRRKYTVTNKRVSVEYGIVSNISKEVRIQDIRSINLTTAGFLGFLGIGRVEFSSAATQDEDVIFWNAPNAAKIRDIVRSLQS